MRLIPWILTGMLALTVSCGGDEGESRKPDVNSGRNRNISDNDSGHTSGKNTELMCEVKSSANACTSCAAGECCAELSRCANDEDCSDLLTCSQGCDEDDSECLSDCRDEFPRGVAPLQAFGSCLADSCDRACDG